MLCDLMMPDPNGQTVYEEVCRARPELAQRFVFMTGGAYTPGGRRFLEDTSAPILEKPFDLGLLRAVITATAGLAER